MEHETIYQASLLMGMFAAFILGVYFGVVMGLFAGKPNKEQMEVLREVLDTYCAETADLSDPTMRIALKLRYGKTLGE